MSLDLYLLPGPTTMYLTTESQLIIIKAKGLAKNGG